MKTGNKKLKYKVAAFTLLEMVLTLILSLFVITILYVSYEIISKESQFDNEKKLTEILNLKSNLEFNFYHSEYIKYRDEVLICEKYNACVNYCFMPGLILMKRGNISDTIYAGNYSYKVLNKDVENLVTMLRLDIYYNDEPCSVLFTKDYYPNQLIKVKDLSFEY